MSDTGATVQSFFREFIFIVFYRKKLVILTTLAMLALSVALAVLLPPVYQSASKFFVSVAEQIDPLQRERSYSLKEELIRQIQSQKELVYSTPVLLRAARQLQPEATEEELIDLVEELRKNLSVVPPKGDSFEGTNVFYMTYKGREPEAVLLAAQALTESYVQAYAELSRTRAEYSYGFFKDQVEQLEAEMKARGQQLRNYEVRHANILLDILNLESGKTNVEVGPQALMTQTQAKRLQLQQELDSLNVIIAALEQAAVDSDIPVVLPEMEGAGKTLSAFRIKVAQLQLQINELRTRFTEAYPPLAELQEELELNIKLLREEFQSLLRAKKIDAQGLESQLAEADRSIAGLRTQINNTAQERSNYENLKQQFQLAQDAYSSAVNQLEKARMAASLNQEKQNLTLVEQAQLPSKPVKPNRPLIVVLGLFGGLLLGLALALTVDFFDHTLKTPEDIERYLGVPCIGSISEVS